MTNEQKAIAIARQQATDDLEIDDNPALSKAEGGGIWVAAWVWVAPADIAEYDS